MPRHYRKLRGNSAYYPFAARTGMRARQRREARALRIAGTVLLGAAAALLLRQTAGRGGQPEAPVQPVPPLRWWKRQKTPAAAASRCSRWLPPATPWPPHWMPTMPLTPPRLRQPRLPTSRRYCLPTATSTSRTPTSSDG